MLAYVMIAIAIALILGSWMWLMPTPYEKKIAILRQKAINAGFYPKFMSLVHYTNWLDKDLLKQQGAQDAQIVRYTWQGASPKRFARKPRNLLLVFDKDKKIVSFQLNLEALPENQWLQYPELMNVAKALASCIDGLLALECVDAEGKRRVSFYWSESGDVAKLDFTAAVFVALQKDL